MHDKRAARIAVGIAIGTAIGGCILPRIVFQELGNDTWPPVWKEAILYFVSGFIAAFSVLILIYRIKGSRNKGKQSLYQNDKSGITRRRTVFDSKLPVNIDWNEINAFLAATKFYKQLLWKDWRKSDAFTIYPISDTSIDCLKCLHEDLSSCYEGGAFVFDENGNEDRGEEYRILRENLYSKYSRIEAKILDGIYYHYLQEDR